MVKNLKSNITNRLSLTLLALVAFAGAAICAPLASGERAGERSDSLPQKKYQLIKSIPLNASLLTSDRLGNCYAVNERQELLKINPKGETTYKFSNNTLGSIALADAGNPLKILLYYKEYSTIILLDNTLSQTGRINLLELGSNQVGAAGLALDNNIWIYDEVLFKLRKIDVNMNVLAESEDLNALLKQTIHANFLLEKDNFLYLNDPALGIFVFDAYGTYSKTIPLRGLTRFQKVQDQLVYFKDGKFYAYHLLTFATEEIALPDKECINAVIEKDRLFILKKNQLDVYSY